jgi:hypothetical protein
MTPDGLQYLCRQCDSDIKKGRELTWNYVRTGICALCARDATDLDHNHHTGRVRGELCHRCNMMIGFIEASGVPLEVIQEYLAE